MSEMSPKMEIQVLPGSLFCIKVVSAVEYKKLDYDILPVHPAKLKKETPPPHQVPVMRYGSQTIPGSQAILKYIDARHSKTKLPLYPTVSKGAADTWATVEDLEKFAHDELSSMDYYFGGITTYGRKNVTQPFLRSVLPGSIATIFPFLPMLGAKALSSKLKKRVISVVGEDVIASETAAKKFLYECLNKLEKCFKTSEQKVFFDTDGPTAADFGVFGALKRLLHPLPDVAEGMSGAYPNALKDAGHVPGLVRFFDYMNKNYYEGKVDWSDARI